MARAQTFILVRGYVIECQLEMYIDAQVIRSVRLISFPHVLIHYTQYCGYCSYRRLPMTTYINNSSQLLHKPTLKQQTTDLNQQFIRMCCALPLLDIKPANTKPTHSLSDLRGICILIKRLPKLKYLMTQERPL